jgi:hypothetical protein
MSTFPTTPPPADAPIQNPDRIDIVGLCQSGGLDLVSVVGAALDGSDDTLHGLAQKVRNFPTEIAAGELPERCPEVIPGPDRSPPKRSRIGRLFGSAATSNEILAQNH